MQRFRDKQGVLWERCKWRMLWLLFINFKTEMNFIFRVKFWKITNVSLVNKSLPLSSFGLVLHPFQPHKDLAPRAPIQLLLLLINKIDLLAKVQVLWFNVLTDFMYNIDTKMWVEFVVGSPALALRGFFFWILLFSQQF